ncbi:hypothetical protein Tco_0752039 [Tanacetum coccineum]|uniref:Uncharacterized protein n=1 Tax=Tanacetum coccineum TaxID=301880 RepID=A0ABQ4Z5Q5_9ASTR
MGSPGVEVPVFEGPPSPDYVPGPDGAEQHLLHRILHTFCSELSTRSSIRTEEMMMLMISFAVPAAVAYSADQGPIHCLSRRGLGCPFEPRRRHLSSPRKLLECVALPYLPHRLSFHYFITTSQIPSLTITYTTTITHVALLLMLRGLLVIPGAGIKSERLLTSYETEDPEMWLPLRKRRVFRTTPGSPPPPLDDEVGESSAAGAARQFGPTTAEADLYGFTDMLEAAPGRQMFLVGQMIRPFHRRNALLIEEEARLSRARYGRGLAVEIVLELRAADQRRQTVISELLKADYRRQRQLAETLKIVKSLKAQMTELQRQQGPAKDPAEPELPEEAGTG